MTIVRTPPHCDIFPDKTQHQQSDIQLTVRHAYENGDIGFCTADWSIAGKAPDGKDVKVGGTSVEVVKKTSGGNWVYVIDSPYGTA